MQLKRKFGFNPDESFVVPAEVYSVFQRAAVRLHTTAYDMIWSTMVMIKFNGCHICINIYHDMR